MATTKNGRIKKLLKANEEKQDRLSGRNSKNEVGRKESIAALKKCLSDRMGKARVTPSTKAAEESKPEGKKKKGKGK